MPIMPEIPEMPIILTRGIDGSEDFSEGSDRSEERLEHSEGNGRFQKRVDRNFGKKRL